MADRPNTLLSCGMSIDGYLCGATPRTTQPAPLRPTVPREGGVLQHLGDQPGHRPA